MATSSAGSTSGLHLPPAGSSRLPRRRRPRPRRDRFPVQHGLLPVGGILPRERRCRGSLRLRLERARLRRRHRGQSKDLLAGKTKPFWKLHFVQKKGELRRSGSDLLPVVDGDMVAGNVRLTEMPGPLRRLLHLRRLKGGQAGLPLRRLLHLLRQALSSPTTLLQVLSLRRRRVLPVDVRHLCPHLWRHWRGWWRT